jgi:hypothetical protein
MIKKTLKLLPLAITGLLAVSNTFAAEPTEDEVKKLACDSIKQSGMWQAGFVPEYKYLKRWRELPYNSDLQTYNLSCQLNEMTDTELSISFEYKLSSLSAVYINDSEPKYTYMAWKEFLDKAEINCFYTSNNKWKCLYSSASFQYRYKDSLMKEGTSNYNWSDWTKYYTQDSSYQEYYTKRLTSVLEKNL